MQHCAGFISAGLNRLIHDLTQALPNMKLKKELCQDPAQGYTYIISITSLASNFSMIRLNRLIHDITQALLNMKLKKELCQDPAQGYTCIISITSLASNFSMIKLNRLIHDITQALPNMKLKKELCQDPCITTNLHQGKVYQSSRRKGVRGGVEATLTKYLGKSRKPKTRHRDCITTQMTVITNALYEHSTANRRPHEAYLAFGLIAYKDERQD